MTDETERHKQVQQAVAGDGDALQRLIIHYHDTLRTIVERRMPPMLRRHLDPEDILQQAYVTTFKSIGGCAFDGSAGFYKWLEQIVLARLANCQRDLKRHKRDVRREQDIAIRDLRAASTSYDDLAARLCAGSTTPSRRLARREAVAAVASSMARLTENQREAIRLRILEGMTAAEVAVQMEKSEAAVNMLTHRGLKALRQRMNSVFRYAEA